MAGPLEHVPHPRPVRAERPDDEQRTVGGVERRRGGFGDGGERLADRGQRGRGLAHGRDHGAESGVAAQTPRAGAHGRAAIDPAALDEDRCAARADGEVEPERAGLEAFVGGRPAEADDLPAQETRPGLQIDLGGQRRVGVLVDHHLLRDVLEAGPLGDAQRGLERRAKSIGPVDLPGAGRGQQRLRLGVDGRAHAEPIPTHAAARWVEHDDMCGAVRLRVEGPLDPQRALVRERTDPGAARPTTEPDLEPRTPSALGRLGGLGHSRMGSRSREHSAHPRRPRFRGRFE